MQPYLEHNKHWERQCTELTSQYERKRLHAYPINQPRNSTKTVNEVI